VTTSTNITIFPFAAVSSTCGGPLTDLPILQRPLPGGRHTTNAATRLQSRPWRLELAHGACRGSDALLDARRQLCQPQPALAAKSFPPPMPGYPGLRHSSNTAAQRTGNALASSQTGAASGDFR
jgi:hypothetical protein